MNRSHRRSYAYRLAIFLSLPIVACLLAGITAAQVNTQPKSKLTAKEDRDDQPPPSVTEMVEKQRILRQKKEYGEMLRRGDAALKLAEQLEESFNEGAGFSPQDLQNLEALEKVVGKIRNELGGDDDDDKDVLKDSSGPENNARRDVLSAFKFLRDSTVRLVDELKKSSRFSISVAAVESSNAVIRIARFLRLKK
jgi:hypothetical protein